MTENKENRTDEGQNNESDESQVKKGAERFLMNGALSMRKIIEYLPAMILSSVSTLLLTTIDGIVVGNLISDKALASVNVFYPISIAIGAATAIVSTGASICLSTAIGSEDAEEIGHLKKSVNVTTIVTAIILTILQIPFIYLIINSYSLDPEVRRMTWQYAMGMMAQTPFGLIATVGVYQLQIMGKMKYLMYLALMEGGLNTLLDFLFVGPLGLGVAGAGMGSSVACAIRCIVSVFILWKTTDIYKTGGKSARLSDIKDIVTSGFPEAANMLMLAVQNYCIIRILLMAFGNDGAVIKGVLAFCYSLASVLMTGIQGAARPMTGLLCGAKDTAGLRILMRQSMVLITVNMTAFTLLFMAFPDVFFSLHGIKTVPDGGAMSLRIYSLFLVAKGMDTIFRLYFANRKDKAFATGLTIVGNATLPVFAFILCKTCDAPWVWLSYLLTEWVILALSLWRYRWWAKEDAAAESEDSLVINLSLQPEDAVDASRWVQEKSLERGFPAHIANRIALCIEEMIGVSDEARQTNQMRWKIRRSFGKLESDRRDRLIKLHNSREEFHRSIEEKLQDLHRVSEADGEESQLQKLDSFVHEMREKRKEAIENSKLDFEFFRDVKQFDSDFWDQMNDEAKTQVVIRITKDEGCFAMIDDGMALKLEESSDIRELLNNNIEFVKRISKSLEYKNILDMNYIVVNV